MRNEFRRKILRSKLNTRTKKAQANNPSLKKPYLNLAIVTGGGDCPGLNAAIRGVFHRAMQHNIGIYGILEGFQGLYKGWMQKMEPLDVSGIVNKGGTILGTSRFNPLKYPDYDRKIKAHLKKHSIDGLITIGGEGTMHLSYELSKIGIPVIGVPKTIDNDIWGTDFTFGFDTAVSIATEAIDRLHTTAESHSRVMILEVMGRHTGWIATYSGIAGGADAILIPEKVFPLSRLLEIINSRSQHGKRFSIIVVSEDAKILIDVGSEKKTMLGTPMLRDEYGTLKLGGIAHLLEAELARHLHMPIRSTILGHVQRGGSPTPYDRILATRLGVAAADLAHKKRFGRMVGLKDNKMYSIALNKVARQLKTVDMDIYAISEIFFR